MSVLLHTLSDWHRVAKWRPLPTVTALLAFLATTAFPAPVSADSIAELLKRSEARFGAPARFDPTHQDLHPAPTGRDELDRMIGQMIMVGFHGTTARSTGARRIAKLMKDGRIGGVILMQRNISSRARLLALTSAFNKAGAELPPFISVDQEGGFVQRLRRRQGFTRVPSAGRIAQRYSLEDAEKIYDRLANQLKTAGINMNFGPVVDLNRNRRNPIIGRKRRSYGASPETVTSYAQAFISAHRRAGIMTAAKHFPGHGSSWADSHHRFVNLTKTWNRVELEPYAKLADAAGPDMVMTGHLYHPDFTDEKGRIPASLSRTAILGELRGRIGFGGIVITDDMEMAAVKRRFTLKDRVVRAVDAGNDIVLFSDATRGGTGTVDLIRKHIRDAVESGRISRTRVRAAYARIKAAKDRLGPKRLEARADLRLRPAQ